MKLGSLNQSLRYFFKGIQSKKFRKGPNVETQNDFQNRFCFSDSLYGLRVRAENELCHGDSLTMSGVLISSLMISESAPSVFWLCSRNVFPPWGIELRRFQMHSLLGMTVNYIA